MTEQLIREPEAVAALSARVAVHTMPSFVKSTNKMFSAGFFGPPPTNLRWMSA
jgi:hypothetical protein